MKRNKILVLAIAGLMAAGCGASKAHKADASPTPYRVNGNTVGANSPNVPGLENTKSSNSTKLSSMRGRRERVDLDPTATPLPLSFEKAGENSQFAITMDRDGAVTETRVFNNHQQLQKVELKWLDAKVRSIKILLKNGKTAEVKSDRITSIRKLSANEILALIGIKGGSQASNRSPRTPKR